MKTIIMTTLNIITNNTIITANAPSTLPTSSRTSLPPPIQGSAGLGAGLFIKLSRQPRHRFKLIKVI